MVQMADAHIHKDVYHHSTPSSLYDIPYSIPQSNKEHTGDNQYVRRSRHRDIHADIPDSIEHILPSSGTQVDAQACWQGFSEPVSSIAMT